MMCFEGWAYMWKTTCFNIRCMMYLHNENMYKIINSIKLKSLKDKLRCRIQYNTSNNMLKSIQNVCLQPVAHSKQQIWHVSTSACIPYYTYMPTVYTLAAVELILSVLIAGERGQRLCRN